MVSGSVNGDRTALVCRRQQKFGCDDQKLLRLQGMNGAAGMKKAVAVKPRLAGTALW